jgi:hypothetical protein
MKPKAKTFDCVEMKNEIQAGLLAEYKAQKDRYPTFEEYVKAKAQESEWVRQFRRRIHSDR